jgi:DnaK suppressor protein
VKKLIKTVARKAPAKPVKKAAKPVAKPASKPVKKAAVPAKPVAKTKPAASLNSKSRPAAKPTPAAKAVVKPAPAAVAKPAVKTVPVAVVAKPAAKGSKASVKAVEAIVASPPPAKREVGVRAGYVKPSKPRPDRVKLAVARQRVVLPAGYKPTANEEYMGPYQLEYFRQRLLQWKSDLIEESKQTIENLKEEVRDVGDEAERATRETENSLELRTRDRYRKLINKIDSTLKRIDDGSYGYCVDTGDEIGLERMEARLTAERTLDAQERWEHLQKQMGD